jgi:hypothetical protein
MKVPTKLAVFALLLIAVFAMGLGLGAVVDSSGTSPSPNHAGHSR